MGCDEWLQGFNAGLVGWLMVVLWCCGLDGRRRTAGGEREEGETKEREVLEFLEELWKE